MKGVQLVGIVNGSSAQSHTNSKGELVNDYYLDIMVDARDPRAEKDSNLHLYTHKYTDKNGVERTGNRLRYNEDQFNQIRAGAGVDDTWTNCVDITNQQGAVVGKAFTFNADVFPSSSKNGGLVVKTDSVRPSAPGFEITDHTVSDNYGHMRANKQLREAARAQEQLASAQVQVQAPAQPRVQVAQSQAFAASTAMANLRNSLTRTNPPVAAPTQAAPQVQAVAPQAPRVAQAQSHQAVTPRVPQGSQAPTAAQWYTDRAEDFEPELG